jgi:hypothetical protein
MAPPRNGCASCPQATAEWAAPDSVDTRLSSSSLPLELDGAQISDRRVPAFRIIEALNIIENVGLCVFSRSVDSAWGPLSSMTRRSSPSPRYPRRCLTHSSSRRRRDRPVNRRNPSLISSFSNRLITCCGSSEKV